MNLDDLIIAPASPPGQSHRVIIRLSGPHTSDLLRPHITPLEAGADESFPGARKARVSSTRLTLPKLQLPCLLFIFHAPRSYTGQDAAEIQLPGNPALVHRVIDALLASAAARDIPARRAEPGEFTARAFLTGRMDLTQAEGVAATISARNDAQLNAAHLLTEGRLGAFVRSLADRLADALALVEAGIDFTDAEDVVPIRAGALRTVLTDIGGKIDQHLARAVPFEALSALPHVVLVGATNAGKSTLFNALLGHPRAIVTDEPGTTRDVLAEPITIDTPRGALQIMLVDAAGHDGADSIINRLMQKAARTAAVRADLILHCTPPAPAPGNRAPRQLRRGELRVRTKIDLVSGDELEAADVAVCALHGRGLGALRRAIADRLAENLTSSAGDVTALLPRHEADLRSARQALRDATPLLTDVEPLAALPAPELLAASMRTALDHLGAITGDVAPDDVLGRIFSTFCIGK